MVLSLAQISSVSFLCSLKSSLNFFVFDSLVQKKGASSFSTDLLFFLFSFIFFHARKILIFFIIILTINFLIQILIDYLSYYLFPLNNIF
jgi:hypothetical protein